MEVLYKLSYDERRKYRPAGAFYLKRPRIINILERDNGIFKYPPGMKYFKRPKNSAYPLDLNKGFERHVLHNRSHGYALDFIEEHVKENDFPSDFGSEGKTKVCTRRNLLNDLMLTPIRERAEKFSFWATKHNGILYLTQNYRKTYKLTPTDTHHFKLQQYCLADEPDEEPDVEVGFDENKELMAIHRSQLKKFDILYSSRMCGVDAAGGVMNMTDFDSINKRKFVITKVLRENCKWKSSHILQKWWAQAHLANVDDIHFGFKGTYDGLIKKPLSKVLTEDLPMIKKFEPQLCEQFLHQILAKVDEKMSSINSPHTVCQVEFNSHQRCFLYKIHEGKNEFTFLTESFIKYLENRV